MNFSGKGKMEKAFFELLETKSYDRITVSELVEKAGVSRSTFYRNYIDIYDMYDKVCKRFIEKFVVTALVDSLKITPKYNEAFFDRLCETIAKQKKYIILLSGEHGDRKFFEHAFEIAEKCLGFLSKTMSHEDAFKIKFVIYAGVGCYIESMMNEEELPMDVLETTKEILNITG